MQQIYFYNMHKGNMKEFQFHMSHYKFILLKSQNLVKKIVIRFHSNLSTWKPIIYIQFASNIVCVEKTSFNEPAQQSV